MTADLFDDPFHLFALLAWVQIAEETGQFPPDSELTRRRAYELFERDKKDEPTPPNFLDDHMK